MGAYFLLLLSLLLRERLVFRHFYNSAGVFDSGIGRHPLPAPTAAFFARKAYFSPNFLILQAVFGSGIGWAHLLQAPTAACFCEKMAYFSPIFPILQAVSAQELVGRTYCLLLQLPVDEENGSFSANFPYSTSCFRLRNRVGAPIACSYRPACYCEKMAVFRLFSLF